MESFGINIDCDGEELNVIKKEKFTNILRHDFINGMKLPLTDLEQVNKPYISTPILYSRFNLLNFITELIEDNSVITNCSALKSLALNKRCSYILFTEKLNSIDKTFYIFHADNGNKPMPRNDQRNLHDSKRLEATLKEVSDNYSTFSCFHRKLSDPLLNIYYTLQIDLYDHEKNTIEIKSLYYDGDPTKTVKQKLTECYEEYKIINTVLQCKIGEVAKVILGIHDGNEAEIIQMNISDLNVGNVKIKVEEEFARMKKDLKEIIHKYNKSVNKGKAVRIQKISLRTRDKWMFTEIDFKDLS